MNKPKRQREDFYLENFRILANVMFALCMFASVLKIDFASEGMNEPQLFQLLSDNLNSILNFSVAFIFLAMFWVKFVGRLHHMARCDNGLLALWLLYLAALCLYPFAENLLGNYPGSSAAQITFSALWAIIGLISLANWSYAYKKKLIDPDLPKQTARRLLYECYPEPVFALLSIPFALYSSWGYYIVLLLTIPANIWISKRFPEEAPDQMAD